MKVSEIGEFGLIGRLGAKLKSQQAAGLILGVGDDAAVWRLGEEVLLATTDTLVENVHFTRDLWPWEDLGWKLLTVNLSDIAAMGGEPLFALVTLALPPQTEVRDIDSLYLGLTEAAREYAAPIIGGDIVRASEVALTLTLIGRARTQNGQPLLLRRDAARPGDIIGLTGTLGDAAGGVRLLREGAAHGDNLVRAQLRPRPQLEIARRAAMLGLRCAIDISDGLVQDLGHICEMSGLGAEVWSEKVPISGELQVAYPEEALQLACTGGEDYQMLFVGPKEALTKLTDLGIAPVTLIGRVMDGPERKVRVIGQSGREIRFADAGWDHLKK